MSLARKRKLNPLKSGQSWSKAKRKVGSRLTGASHWSAILTPNTERSHGNFTDASLPRRPLPKLQRKAQMLGQDPVDAGHNGENVQQCCSPALQTSLPEEDADQGLVITLDDEQHGDEKAVRKKSGRRRRDEAGEATRPGPDHEGPMEIDQQLDRELESKSRQHNLTTVNVRNIIHEVITNEHVVAMMKAAITETEAIPIFEPKMTRSKLKEVVEKGVVIPTWNISPMKKPEREKAPQFVDIPLEEEDSSDEEYCPDEDEEDETTEETLLESDMESTASSPRGSRVGPPRGPVECEEERGSSPNQGARRARHLQVEVIPMGPPPPPQPPVVSSEFSFMEKLHAVEEELATMPACMEPFQALSGGGAHGDGLMAFRTRSKRPLRDVPLGQLEAELRAPDITPDMYECGSGPEDREWTQWLQGLMASDVENEEEADDDDDPEYNFLDDIDEPDLEDYRNDRAVRITKKEVNELMEELFETFQDDLLVRDLDEEGHEEEEDKDEDIPPADTPKFNIPQTIRAGLSADHVFEEPPVHVLTEQHRTVREQLEALKRQRALLGGLAPPPQDPAPALMLSNAQKQQLQQQMQQHTQLLVQVHLLTRSVTALQNEADTTCLFLLELQAFAQCSEQAQSVARPGFISVFRACNLQGALSLLEEFTDSVPSDTTLPQPRRVPPARSYPVLPARVAWLLATRPVFLYPELLPHCSLDPSRHPPRCNTIYTRGEESLLVLGLRDFGETVNPYQLMSQYLLKAKSPRQIRRHIHDMCQPVSPANAVKFYCQHKKVPRMLLACGRVTPDEQHPPVEREEMVLPVWLRKSLPHIHKVVEEFNCPAARDTPLASQRKASYTFLPGTHYPPSLPETLTLRPAGFRCLRPPSVSVPSVKPGVSNLSVPASGNSATLRPEEKTAPPRAEERAELILPRKLCPIQPALPKPSMLQLLTVAAGEVLNVVDLSGTAAVGSVSTSEGSDTLCLGPVQGCSSVSPAVVINLVSPVAGSVISPVIPGSRLAGTLNEPALLTGEPVARSAGTVACTCKITGPLLPAPKNTSPSAPEVPANHTVLAPLPLVITLQPKPSPVLSTVPIDNRTEVPNTLVSKEVPDVDATHVISPLAWKHSRDSPAHPCSGETAASPVMSWPSCPTLLGQTEAPGAPDAGAGYAEGPASPGRHVSSGPPSGVRLKMLVRQTEAQHTTALQGTGEHLVLAAEPSSRGCAGNLLGAGVPLLPPAAEAQSEEHSSQWEDEERSKEEERDGADFGSPMLALTESSMSPCSSLDGQIGSLQGSSDMETDNLAKSGPQRGRGGWDSDASRDRARDVEGARREGSSVRCSSPVLPSSKLTAMEPTIDRYGSERWRLEDGGEERRVAIEERGWNQRSGQDQSQTEAEARFETLPEDDDDENAMSSTSEKSVLSVPELQETMDKLTWLASESRLHEDSASQEEESPQSSGPNCTPHTVISSVYQSSPPEEEVMPQEGGTAHLPVQEDPVHSSGGGRDHVDVDPEKERKEVAFAQVYLNRVVEALRNVPGKVEQFLHVLEDLGRHGGGHGELELLARLRSVLGEWPELLRDFAAFLRPEQAHQCGLSEEQQAFEHSRSFLQQLDSSCGDAASDYQEVLAVLQGGRSLSTADREEVKAHISKLLKSQPCLQKEFWMFFNELHPSPSHQDHSEVAPKHGNVDGEEGSSKVRREMRKLSIHRKKKPSRVGKIRHITPIPTKGPLACTRTGERERHAEVKGQKEKNKEEDWKVEVGTGAHEDPAGPKLVLERPPSDPVLCAKNISLTPSGERIIIWTREMDRTILIACQNRGASWNTFHAVSAQLGNKSASEVAKRFHELLHLFHTASKSACPVSQSSTVKRLQEEPS